MKILFFFCVVIYYAKAELVSLGTDGSAVLHLAPSESQLLYLPARTGAGGGLTLITNHKNRSLGYSATLHSIQPSQPRESSYDNQFLFGGVPDSQDWYISVVNSDAETHFWVNLTAKAEETIMLNYNTKYSMNEIFSSSVRLYRIEPMSNHGSSIRVRYNCSSCDVYAFYDGVAHDYVNDGDANLANYDNGTWEFIVYLYEYSTLDILVIAEETVLVNSNTYTIPPDTVLSFHVPGAEANRGLIKITSTSSLYDSSIQPIPDSWQYFYNDATDLWFFAASGGDPTTLDYTISTKATQFINDGEMVTYQCIDSSDAAYYRWKGVPNQGTFVMIHFTSSSEDAQVFIMGSENEITEATTGNWYSHGVDGNDWAFAILCGSTSTVNMTITVSKTQNVTSGEVVQGLTNTTLFKLFGADGQSGVISFQYDTTEGDVLVSWGDMKIQQFFAAGNITQRAVAYGSNTDNVDWYFLCTTELGVPFSFIASYVPTIEVHNSTLINVPDEVTLLRLRGIPGEGAVGIPYGENTIWNAGTIYSAKSKRDIEPIGINHQPIYGALGQDWWGVSTGLDNTTIILAPSINITSGSTYEFDGLDANSTSWSYRYWKLDGNAFHRSTGQIHYSIDPNNVSIYFDQEDSSYSLSGDLFAMNTGNDQASWVMISQQNSQNGTINIAAVPTILLCDDSQSHCNGRGNCSTTGFGGCICEAPYYGDYCENGGSDTSSNLDTSSQTISDDSQHTKSSAITAIQLPGFALLLALLTLFGFL